MVDKVPRQRVIPGLRQGEGSHVPHVSVRLRRVDVAAPRRAPDGAVSRQASVPRRQRGRRKHVGQITVSHCQKNKSCINIVSGQ